MSNGQINEIAEVTLDTNQIYSQYTGTYALTSQIEALPDIQGYGLLPNLQVEMSFDPTLTTLVQNLVSLPPATVTQYDQAVQNIMYEWANAEDVLPTAGNIFDGQKLDFLQSYVSGSDRFSTNPSQGKAPWFIGQAIELNASWNDAFDAIEARFLVQINPIFQQSFAVMSGTDLLMPVPNYIADENEIQNNPSIDLSVIDYITGIQNIEQNAPTDINNSVTYWVQALNIISQSIGDYIQSGPINAAGLFSAVDSGIPFFISDDVIEAALSGTLTYVEMSALNNVVYGTAGTDLFDVSQSNMKIEGFGGGDEIIVNPGVANLQINEVENNPSNANVLFLAPGVNESNIEVASDATGDIILTYDAKGDQVTLDNMLFGPTSGSEQGPLHTSLPYTSTTEYGVQDIIFSDGTTWTAQQVIDMLQDKGSPTNTTLYSGSDGATLDPAGYANSVVGHNGKDTILYNEGYGDITLNESNASGIEQSVLQFGSSITANEIQASGDAAGDLILTLGTTGTQITLVGMNGSAFDGIAEAVFADGETLTAAQLLANAGVGSPVNTTLYANADTSILDAQGEAHEVVGAGSNDEIVYNEGYGDLTITRSSGSPVLAFGSNVSETNIAVSQDAQGDIIFTDIATGATINVVGMASSGTGVGEVTFSDGATWNSTQILELGDTGNTRNQSLYLEAGNNIFNPAGYAHYIQSGYGVYGGNPAYTVLYNLGYGDLTINDIGNFTGNVFGGVGPALNGTLQIGAGITESGLYVSADGNGDIVLTVGADGSRITIPNMLNTNGSGSYSQNYGIAEVTFSDGTVWSWEQILSMADTGSPTNTTIYAAPSYGDTIDPDGYAHVIDGTGSASVVDYNSGYGSVTLNEGNNSPPTTIVLGAGIIEAEVSVENIGLIESWPSENKNENLVLNIGDGGDQITINNFAQIDLFSNVTTQFGQLDFADGTTWSASTILALGDTATPGETTLAPDADSNIFNSKGYAHEIDTNGLQSTVLYDFGYGTLLINDANTDTTLQFGAGITEADVTATILSYSNGIPFGGGGLTLLLNIGTSGDQVTLATNGEFGAVSFADGTTWTGATLLQLADKGTYEGEVLTPDATSNVFDPNGEASEIFSTISGSDTIAYAVGNGNLTVDLSSLPEYELGGSYAPYAYTPNDNVLELEAGITAQDISVVQDAQGDLKIYIDASTDSITLIDMMANMPSSTDTSTPQYGIASAVFADGTTLTAQQLVQLSETGSTENDPTLSSSFMDTTFNANGYVREVNGVGGDTIEYSANGGDLVVNEIARASTLQNGILQLGPGITEAEVQLKTDSLGDIILQVGSAENQITLTGMNEALTGIEPEYGGIGSIIFADGTTWTSSSIVSMLENGSSFNNNIYSYEGGQTFDSKGVATLIQDYNEGTNSNTGNTYLYDQGYGQLTISAASDYYGTQDRLSFGDGIVPSAVTVSGDASGDIVMTDGIAGDTIILSGMLDAANSGVGSVVFTDGTTWSAQQILDLADIGSAQGTTLYAGYEPNVFDPNGFAHLIVDDNQSSIFYNQGYGNLEIQAALNYVYGGSGASGSSGGSGAGHYEPDESALTFGSGISFSDLSFVLNENGAVIVTFGTDHSRITLDNALTVGVPSFVFADGAMLTSEQIIADAEANVSDGTLVGSAGIDTLAPGGLYTTVLGQGGADTILYDRADGNLNVIEYAGNGTEQSVLQLGAGIAASDLAISSDASDDILVTIAGTPDQITLSNMLDNPSAGVSEFIFSDGSTLSAVQITADAQIGSAENTALYADGGFNTLILNGSATLAQDFGGGTDIIQYGALDGDLTVDLWDGSGPEQSILQFGSGISASEMSFSTDGNGNIIVNVGSSGKQIILDGMYGDSASGVAGFAFADGTTLSAMQIDALVLTASPENTALWGAGGTETLVPDAYTTFVGDYFGGSDTIAYTLDDGDLEIDEEAYGTAASNVLTFGAGISASDIAVSRGDDASLVLTITSTGQTITLDNMAEEEVSEAGRSQEFYGIQTVAFADGTTLTARQLVDMTNVGSAAETVLSAGGVGANNFDPNGYASIIYGSGLADTIRYNLGDGNLTINEPDVGLYNSYYPAMAASTLVLGAGITESQVFASEDSQGDVLLAIGTTGSMISLTGMLPSPQYSWEREDSDYGIGSIVFADGTTWSAQQIIDATEIGSSYNITLIAANGNTVDPNVYANLVEGYGGSSTILYNQGYGNLAIDDTTPGTLSQDVLSFGTSISESEVAVVKQGSDIDLVVAGTGNGTITLINMNYNWHQNYPYAGYGVGDAGVGLVTFADGTAWNFQKILVESDIGSADNVSLTANPGDNIFDPNGFAHSVTDTSGGTDTILYNAGYGNLTVDAVNPSGSEQSVLRFGSSITASDVLVSQDANGDVLLSLVSMGSIITLEGMAGSANDGVGSVTFTDGTTWTAAQILGMEQTGTLGSTGTLYGGYGPDTFNPNSAVHVIDGGTGDNTILYDAGDGDLTINETASSAQQSVLQFGSGISATDIQAVGDAAGDIILTVASLGTQITLTGMLANSLAGVGSLTFADGSNLTARQLVEMAETGSAVNSTLYGNGYGVELTPNGPAHIADIGLGAESLDYEQGDGNLTIKGTYATGNGQAGDVLAFGTGISTADLSASSVNGNDLILTIGTTGSQITLTNMLTAGQTVSSTETLNYGVSEITFTDGTTLSPAQVIALLNTGSQHNSTLTAGSGDNTLDPAGYAHVIDGNGGTDTVLYDRGYGNLLINEQNADGAEQSVLELGTSIAVADIEINGDAHGDILLTDTVTGAQITLANMLESGTGGVAYGVGSIVFEGAGTTLTATQLFTAEETGSPSNTTLYAGAGNTTFQTDGYAQLINGKGGADTILYTLGAGNLQIDEQVASGAEQSVLQFGSGISVGDLSVTTDGYGDVIVHVGTSGAEIGLTNMLSGTQYGVGSFVFADDTTLTAAQIEAELGTITAVDTTLYATLASETLDTKGYYSAIQGNGGADTIVYNPGYGNLTITEQSYPDPEQSVLQLGTGITEADVAVSQDQAGDIILGIGSPAAQITLVGMLESDLNGVAAVEFSDGTTWTAAQIIAMTETGSAEHTTLVGGPGNNVFNPNGYAHVIDGDGGADTIAFNLGDGTVTVNEENQSTSEQSVLQFGTGIAAADISVSQDTYGNVVLTVGTAGDAVILSNMINSGQNGISFGVGSATFVDGTTLTAQQITDLAETGSPTNTVLRAGPNGDTIDPNGYAHLVLGNSGTNTILYDQGYGQLTIAEQAASGTQASILQFGSGISASDLSATTDNAGDIILMVGGTTDQVTLTSMASSLAYGIGDAVFADGTTLTAEQISTLASSTTSLASSFSGGIASIVTTDEGGVTPFASLTVVDSNSGASTETITVSLSNGADGVLDDPNAQTDGVISQNGALTFSGSAEEISTILDALIFTPTAHQVSPGDSVTTTLTVTDENSTGMQSSTAMAVTATAVNDAPVISGTVADQASTDQVGLSPFSGVTISDPDLGASDSLIITLTGTNGTATDANGTLSGTGLSKVGTGVYSLAAVSPASLSTELDGLTFAPTLRQVAPGDTVTTEFDLAVTQNGLTAIDNATCVIVTAAPTTLISGGTLYALQSGLTLNTGGTLHAVSSASLASTILYNEGYGALVVMDANPSGPDQSTLQLGAGISETSLKISSDAAGDILLQDGIAGDEITLTGMNNSLDDGIGSVQFADGTTWTGAELAELAALQSTASTASDYSLEVGAGARTISGGGIFVIGEGITKNDVAFESNNNNGNLTILLLGANGQPTGDSLTITGYWWNEKGQATVLYPDGSTLSVGNSVLNTWLGSTTQTNLVGSDFSPNLFDLGPGGDQVTLGATYDGGNGQNTLEFGYGDGAVIVTPNEASETIAFSAAISPSDVIFESNNNNGNLTIELLDANGQPAGDSMTIDGYWENGSGINQAVFANGTTLTLNHQLTETWFGTSTQTTLVGSDFDSNVFDLGPGGDQVTLGANYDGGTGQNIVNFGSGDGAVTINGYNGLATINLAAGIDLADTSLSTDSNGDLVLTLADGTDKLIVSGGMYSSAFQQLNFADGTTMSHSEILYTAETGTTGNDTISATSGAEVIDGRGGDDLVNGGGGYDSYIYRQSYGNLTINNAAAGGTVANGELDFGPGITADDLWFSQSGNNLDINVIDSKSQIVVDNWFGGNSGAQLSEIKVDGGLEIDSGVNKLVAAMAAFEANNTAFNPEAATQIPNDANLQAALAAAWHQAA